MAKGKASISATGASMSKYDVEVEARLQALEKVAHPIPTGATQQKVDDRLAALEAAVTALQVSTQTPEVSVDVETVAKLVDVVKAVSPKAATNMGL